MMTMRNSTVVLALCVLATSCALFDTNATPRQKYVESQEAFILATSAAVEAKKAGLIKQEHWDEVVLPLIVEGDKILDSMKVMVDEGRFDQVELFRQALVAIVLRLQLEGG